MMNWIKKINAIDSSGVVKKQIMVLRSMTLMVEYLVLLA